MKNKYFILIISIIFLFAILVGGKIYFNVKEKEEIRVQESKKIKKQKENFAFVWDLILALNEIHDAEEYIVDLDNPDEYYKAIYSMQEKYNNSKSYIEEWKDTDDEIIKEVIKNMGLALDNFDSFVNAWLDSLNTKVSSNFSLAYVKIQAGREKLITTTYPIIMTGGGLDLTVDQKTKLASHILELDWFNKAEIEKGQYLRDNGNLDEFQPPTSFLPLFILANGMLIENSK